MAAEMVMPRASNTPSKLGPNINNDASASVVPAVRKVYADGNFQPRAIENGKEQKNEEASESSNGDSNQEKGGKDGKKEDRRRRLKKKECLDKLGFGYPTWKKWAILSVIFVVQWDADHQKFAVGFIVLSSVLGSVVGPIVGGFIEASHLSWRWIFWIQLIFGGATQIIHLFVPETEENLLIDREAKRRRESGQDKTAYGPNEMKEQGLTFKSILKIWGRPFQMFFTEPIVLCLSLLSGFSDALIFTFIESFNLVYKQWGFSTRQISLAYIPIVIEYFIAYLSFFPPFLWHRREIKRKADVKPEFRLYWLLFTAPLETIGLFIFAWTSLGPPVPWIAPMIASALIGIANYSIYMTTIDYMVAAYGPYAASATGGNALARDFLAGIAAIYATPMYENIGHRYHLEWPSTILAILALIFTLPIYIFYYYGPQIHERSKFAQTLTHADDDDGGEEERENEKDEA